MAATTIGAVYDRIHTLVVAQGFVRAVDVFDFDHQPSQSLEMGYRIETTRTGSEGFLGGDQMEMHEVVIWIARKTKRDPHGAARQLKVDLDLIEQEIATDQGGPDYWTADDFDVESEVRQVPGADYVVGRLMILVEFDRSLS